MAMVNPQTAADNWAAGMASSTQKLTAAINAVTESPMEKAAQAVDRQVLGVQMAANSGKTAARLRAVPIEAWKKAFIEKGVGRIAQGAAQAKPKMAAFLTKFLPHVAQGVASLPPRGDIEANIARSAAMARHNHQFKATNY